MKSFHLLAIVLSAVQACAADIPKRIVSTAPGITEILFALGLGDRVVGVTNYCRYPPQVTKLPKIGSWMTPNMEVILKLQPDLVIVQRTPVHDSSKFRSVQLRTLDVHLDRTADIFSTMEAIGGITGVSDRARTLSAKMRSDLELIRSRAAAKPRTSVLFVVGRNPGTLEGIVAVGPQSYLSEVIDLVGGRNILQDSPVPYAKVLHEEILTRNPQVIIDIVDMGEHADAAAVPAAKKRADLALWSRYATIPAVRDRRVHILSSELFIVPGPRVVECAREIARLLHPEIFR